MASLPEGAGRVNRRELVLTETSTNTHLSRDRRKATKLKTAFELLRWEHTLTIAPAGYGWAREEGGRGSRAHGVRGIDGREEPSVLKQGTRQETAARKATSYSVSHGSGATR